VVQYTLENVLTGRLHNRKRKQVQLSWYLHLSSTFALAWFLGGGDTMFDVTMFVEFSTPTVLYNTPTVLYPPLYRQLNPLCSA